MSFAIAGPLSKVVSMETIFLIAGLVPVLLAAVAMVGGADAARRDRQPAAVSGSQTPNIGGSASTMTSPQKKWVSMGASTPPVIRRS